MESGTSSANRSAPRISGLLGVFLGILPTIGVIGGAVWLSTGVGLLRLLGMFRTGQTSINVSQPTVVVQIQQLQELETGTHTMDKIISGERDNPYLPKFLAGDRLLLVVHGQVIAGVDLAKVQPADVIVHGQSIVFHVPQAEIFSTLIDNSRTRVYSRDTGLFTSPDPDLETEVRAAAERQLQQAALQDGILKTADQNARSTLASMLKGFGFSQVEIQ